MTFKVGPFTLYRAKRDSTLDISLTAFSEYPFGWEYGWQDPMAGRTPWVEFRLGKLLVFSFEGWKNENGLGFEIWVLGFWWVN